MLVHGVGTPIYCKFSSKHIEVGLGDSVGNQFALSLKQLKEKVAKWAREWHKKQDGMLIKVYRELDHNLITMHDGINDKDKND